MNGDDGDSDSSRRWWIDPVLARLAFGASTQGMASDPSPSPGLSHGWLAAGATSLDLDDPKQREFGDYELIEQIGRGGMGSIYRARQRNLGREVAIKLLSAGQRASDELVDSLRREARHTAQLQHPNIVVVHEMGEHVGLIYYAMQLVPGRSLSEQLQSEGAMAPAEAARLLRTAAEAVDYAHRLGVLHLDIKPGNILINELGEPLIADFGLARRLEQALDNERVSGTPSYMAPEQAQVQGHPLSPATDVWALGAVLYETLTGQPPFDFRDSAQTLRLLLQGHVRRPSRLRPVPPDLEAISLHCLAKDPAQRYASARALADDLGRYLDGRPVSVRPLNGWQRARAWARREPRLAMSAALALLALMGGVVATSWQWQRAQGDAAIASARLWQSRREAARQLQASGNGAEAVQRLLANVAEEERDGKYQLARLERRRIDRMLVHGAVAIHPATIASDRPLAVGLSDDGSLLAIAASDQSLRWYDTTNLRERGRVLLAWPGSERQPRAPLRLRFIDGHRLLVTRVASTGKAAASDDGWLVDLDHSRAIRIDASAPPQAATR
jgi:serine/threonine protein kinase